MIFWFILIQITLHVKPAVATFSYILGTIWPLFIPTSGHTVRKGSMHVLFTLFCYFINTTAYHMDGPNTVVRFQLLNSSAVRGDKLGHGAL